MRRFGDRLIKLIWGDEKDKIPLKTDFFDRIDMIYRMSGKLGTHESLL
jgi:hypothetical protein